eukprot:gene20471-27259_t
MNGGNVIDDHNPASMMWQRLFKEEMNDVAKQLLAPGTPDHKYLNLTKKKRNIMGSAMSIMLCDIENEALLTLKEFLESDRLKLKVGVLMFDGCLVERSSECTQQVLDAASDFIYGKTGMRLAILIKDMTTDMLQVPFNVYTGPPMPPPRYVQDDMTAGFMLLEDLKYTVVSCGYRLYVRDGIAWTDDKAAVDTILHRRCLVSNINQINNEGVVRKYSAVFNKAINISSVVKNDTRSFLEDAGDDLTLVREVFKVSEDKRDFVLLADINQWGKLNGMSKTKLQDRLARMGAVKNDQCCIDGVRHGRGFLNLLMGEAV